MHAMKVLAVLFCSSNHRLYYTTDDTAAMQGIVLVRAIGI